MKNKILLSFDVEEFDIIEEYGQKISEKEKMEYSKKGTEEILYLLDKLGITATFFITANFAKTYPSLIKKIGSKHEIASHGFYHSSFQKSDFVSSKKTLEKISGKKIEGFRMPRLQKISYSDLLNAGYIYDSSINPTYLPGRYNHFFRNRKPSKILGIYEIPISTLPLVRFPLFWLSFKNLPSPLFYLFTKIALKVDGHLNLFFHPWEFIDLYKFELPFYVRRASGKKLLIKLERYLSHLKKSSEFCTLSEFTHSIHTKKQKEELQKRV